ncbi:ATP-binding protein [Natrinema marinum]|uniref:ATP-binding protein n=1 Tax=Natrinema marinum TaxID=2961598 RepID=UPI0020C8F687|nr:ATP-binding protein [Natrinema marinum]
MVKADFPSSIDPRVKFLDRYTVWDIIRISILASIGWLLAESAGATIGIFLGFLLTEFKPGGKTLDAYLIDAVKRITTAPTVSSPELRKLVDGTVILDDDTVLGIVRVSSHDLDYASEPERRANRDTVSELLNGVDYPVEIYSQQRLVDLSEYQGTNGSTVTTDHYVIVKSSRQTLAENHREVKRRGTEVRSLLTAGDLYAESLTGAELKAAVENLYLGKLHLSRKGFETEYGQKRVCRMLYIDEYPGQLPLGWIAEVLNQQNPGLIDIVQDVKPVSNYQRNWMDRMLARVRTEISATWRPSRQANLREQELGIEQRMNAEASGETLVNHGIYVIARGETSSEADKTMDAVKSVLNRHRVETREPRYSNQAVKAISAFHRCRFDESEIVPGDSAATGFSFGTKDSIEAGGIKVGDHRNDSPVILDRFSWDASHITVMGKNGSGKTYWTGLTLVRSAVAYDDLEIYIVDPKKGDYSDIVDALGGETVFVSQADFNGNGNDVVRFTVEDPSRDNTEKLAETVRYIHRQASKTDRKTLVVIDEAHRVTTKGNRIYQDGVQALSNLIRETRHKNVAATLVTQNADEFTRSNEGRNILRNVDCNLFFKQKDVASQVTDFFQLSEKQSVELRKLRTGNSLPFSEAIVKGPVDTRIRVQASQEEHRLLENGENRDMMLPSLDSAGSVEPRTEENGEKRSRTDGGHETISTDNTDPESTEEYGFLKLIGFVLGAPIGLFEYGLLAGFPVATALYWNNMLTSVLPIGLPLNGTLVDILAVWTATLIAAELLWILLLSVENWLAQPRR